MPALREAPEDFLARVGLQARAIRLFMLHLRVLLHFELVLGVVLERVEQKFVVDLTGILEHELDLLALLHFDPVGRVGHRAGPIGHDDLHGPERLLGVARLARGKAVIRVAGVGRGLHRSGDAVIADAKPSTAAANRAGMSLRDIVVLPF